MISDIVRSITRGSWKARLIAAAVLLAAVFVIAIVVDAALGYDRIHPGVEIAGVPVGRLTRDEASAVLNTRVKAAAEKPITLMSAAKEWPVRPTALGVKIDVEATVDEAFAAGRSSNILRNLAERFGLYVSSRRIPLTGSIDSVLLDELMTEISDTLDKPPVNAGVAVKNGDVRVIEGKDGMVVDQDDLRAQLKVLLMTLHDTTVKIPLKVQAPAIEAADTSGVVEQVKTMIASKVSLKLDDHVWTVSPDQITSSLEFKTEGEGDTSRLVAFVSPKKLASLFKEVGKAAKREAKSATWETDGSTATLISSKTGRVLDAEKTAEAITQAALSPTDRVAKVAVKESPPNRTTEQAKGMGIVKKIGAYTTEFGGSANRRANVQRAAKLINGTLLAPGAEFDFDTVVGQRTESNGFKTAPVIVAGGKLEDSLGGGICQVSTTLFNAVFFAGLDVTARTNHSLYISHYPKGRDATVSWGGPAFRFRNDTPNWILIKSASSSSSLTFVLYGTPVNRKVTYTTGDWYNIQSPTEKRVKNPDLPVGKTQITDDGQTGKQIKVTRKVVQDGKTIHSDVFVSSYPMHPKIIEEGSKVVDTTTTTTKSTTTTTIRGGTTTTTAHTGGSTTTTTG